MSARPFRLPLSSLLHRHLRPGDFLDSYAVSLPDPRATPLQLAQHLADMPRWVTALLALRDGLVRPFGLKTAADFPPPSSNPGIGDYVNFFRVDALSETEAILGENDRHLDYRVSVLKTLGPDPKVVISTWVHPHNSLGRLYLAGVLPFHKLIVKRMLARLAA